LTPVTSTYGQFLAEHHNGKYRWKTSRLLVTMHWQRVYKPNPSEVSLYEVMHN